MKSLKVLLLLAFCFIGTANVFSQQKDEITLTVSADGASKEEAIKVALRSAIEQSYETFVSGNTTILDDELVKDEIVKITNGNIKKYQEVASNIMPDGKFYVTLKATVCISKLVSYAQSKGAETEFAGATFGMNMKLKELNKKSELIALYNLYVQMAKLGDQFIDINLDVKEPQMTSTNHLLAHLAPGYSSMRIPALENVLEIYSQDYYDPERTRGEKMVYNEERKERFRQWLLSAENSYLITMNVNYKTNSNTKKIIDLFTSTIESISLSKEELEEYKNLNIPTRLITFSFYDLDKSFGIGKDYYFRNNNNEIIEWENDLIRLFSFIFSEFSIIDNLGTESAFNAYMLAIKPYLNIDNNQYRFGDNNEICKQKFETALHQRASYRMAGSYNLPDYDNCYMLEGEGLFKFALVNSPIPVFFRRDNQETCISIDKDEWSILFLIPKSEISKYTNFIIEQ